MQARCYDALQPPLNIPFAHPTMTALDTTLTMDFGFLAVEHVSDYVIFGQVQSKTFDALLIIVDDRSKKVNYAIYITN